MKTLLILSLLSIPATIASAGQVHAEYAFIVSAFSPSGGPAPTISGTFDTTFTPFDTLMNGTNSSTLDLLSLQINGKNYTPSDAGLVVRNARTSGSDYTGRFELGGLANGGIYGGGNFSDDFDLFFTDLGNGVYAAPEFEYTVASSGNFYDAGSISITRVSAVPEPATALFGIATAAAALVSRRRRNAGSATRLSLPVV